MQPLVKFHKFIAQTRSPTRADRSACGSMPMRAFRYCEALTAASALGWYVFPPISFSLLWDGHEIGWKCNGLNEYIPLHEAQFPYLSAHFDTFAPADLAGFCPPFLNALPETGVVQIWSGLFAETRPNHSLILRPPVNSPRANGYDVFEGVIEADRWFGPLFTNVRLTRTGYPVLFDPAKPLFMVQPVQRALLSNESLNDFETASAAAFTDQDWVRFRTTILGHGHSGCPMGKNAVERRKREAAERDMAG